MQFDDKDEYASALNGKRVSSGTYAPPPRNRSSSSSQSIGSPVFTMKDKFLSKCNDLLLDLPMPNTTPRNLSFRGTNASKYFNEAQLVSSTYGGHISKLFQLIRLMKWYFIKILHKCINYKSSNCLRLNFMEDPLQEWDSIRDSTIYLFSQHRILSVDAITRFNVLLHSYFS